MNDQRTDREVGGLIAAFFALIACSFAAGCGQPPRDETIHWGIAGGVGSCRGVGNNMAQLQLGNTKYDCVVRNGELFVNGTNYGAIRGGDNVIATEQELLINGKPAHPKED